MLNFFDPQFLHIGQLLAFNRLVYRRIY